jgi:phosphatidylserine/phosphatidylglycerophosphate/cardiolipin synthase-like enzyme
MPSIRLAAAVATLALAGCTAPADEDLGEPDLDSGKADGAATPVLKGLLPIDVTQDVVLDDKDGNAVQYVYFHLELSDAATIGVDAAPGDDGLVPAIYVYHPNGSTWGHSLAHGTSHVEAQLAGAGTYRVMVRRKVATGTPHVGVSGTCDGTGCTPPQIGCTPTAARTQPPTVFVGPTSWQQSIEAAIDSAAGTLDVQMYLFTVTDIAQHIIAAHQRGVAVRVLLDPPRLALPSSRSDRRGRSGASSRRKLVGAAGIEPATCSV